MGASQGWMWISPGPDWMSTGRGLNEEDRSRLQAEIEELELKLKQLRRERAETFDDGRKAGYLPGELEGKGIIP